MRDGPKWEQRKVVAVLALAYFALSVQPWSSCVVFAYLVGHMLTRLPVGPGCLGGLPCLSAAVRFLTSACHSRIALAACACKRLPRVALMVRATPVPDMFGG